MAISQRLKEIREGFEPAFWVANVTELFERLSYYGAFASLANYLHESLQFPTERAGSLAGLFGGMVWFLAAFGGTVADRLGFRRALSLAYLILSCSYFLLGSIGAPWLAPIRAAVPLVGLVIFILMLPALGVALVKPCVVGTTARASSENVRSLGYSIYYTLVNIGGAAGPYVASWVHRHLSVENVFRVAALSVFLMFFAVLLFFKEPRRSGDSKTPSLKEAARNFCVVLGNYRLVLPVLAIALILEVVSLFAGFVVPWWIWIALSALVLAGLNRFMWFLVIFSGYWIVFWQEFIGLPLYIHAYIDPKADVELILVTDAAMVIAFQLLVSYLTKKIPAFRAVILGTLVTSLAWLILAAYPTVWGAVLALMALATGEMIQAPRYYEYISRLAPAGQQGTYMGFAFLPIGIGSLIGGWFGGRVLHHFGEVAHRPAQAWGVITGVGVLTALLLWIYDRIVKPGQATTQTS